VLKVVIDTNIFVASFLGRNDQSYPAQIISMWRARAFTLVISPQILQELVGKLLEKGIEDKVVEDFVRLIGKIALYIPGAYESTKLDHIDPDDNIFLAASFESKADYIVSYDAKSLLPLKYFHGALIVTPALFMRVLVGNALHDKTETLDTENPDR
jgi:uncharacterized protein